ncbi:hypothetical protein OHB12_29540 [Nocardia sp. NBC_01730]|uniref:DUF7373 family lipoprotein n=1 Tax=Nocardia sp. NBC_01730 TaxID=2975998 RepID=UPI002E0F88F5|nr:hypothetical protein OHB12_29540 [Nocardia sp. NBC_01730]
MRYRLRTFAILASSIVLAAGCSSTVDGNPQPGMSPVDLTILKTGALATEPTAYNPRITSANDVRFIEARRMLNYLVQPFDVDSDLTDVGYVKLIATPLSMVNPGAFPEKYQVVGEKYNVLAGAYVSRTNGNLRSTKKLIISILRFPTETDSRNAADEFDRITNEEPGRHPVPIDGYPDARSTSGNDLAAIVFLQHGPYVITANAGVPEPNKDALASVLKKTIDRQIAELDKQQPVPLDDLLDLPLDPDGIMRRAAPSAKDYSDPFFGRDDFGPYQPSGILHFERNPIEVRTAFEEGGVDLIGRQSGTVYRTRDLPSAFRLQAALAKPEKNDEVVDPPPGLADTRCLKLDFRDINRLNKGLCVIVYDRYVAVVVSQFPDISRVDRQLLERTAAQYSILAKSG